MDVMPRWQRREDAACSSGAELVRSRMWRLRRGVRTEDLISIHQIEAIMPTNVSVVVGAADKWPIVSDSHPEIDTQEWGFSRSSPEEMILRTGNSIIRMPCFRKL